jgi:DNA-binding IclR family transcriptional regulator
MAAEYQAGATVYELAARFKIHRATVSEHLHSLGVAMRRRGLDQGQVDQAATLYAQGWSVARIGGQFRVDGGTVWLALRAAGVQLRDTHGRER